MSIVGVLAGIFSIREEAEQLLVPKSSLDDRVYDHTKGKTNIISLSLGRLKKKKNL